MKEILQAFPDCGFFFARTLKPSLLGLEELMPRALFPWQDEICRWARPQTVVQFVLRLWELVRKHANSTSDANFSGTSKL